MSITLVGVFDEYSDAQKACEKLEQAGIEKHLVKLTGEQTRPEVSSDLDSKSSDEKPGAISRFFSDLFGSDDSDNASHYSEAVRRGNAVVTVQVVDDAREEEIRDILDDCGAVDVNERVEAWKTTGYTPTAGRTSGAQQEFSDGSGDSRMSRAGSGIGAMPSSYPGTERRFNRNPTFSGTERRALM